MRRLLLRAETRIEIMDYLVGSTGFVGSNLARQHPFDGRFHSTDVTRAYGKKPDLLVYAGVRAEMFLANRDPAADRREIERAQENIARIAPEACVLISTIAVYPDTHGVDEFTEIETEDLSAYGANRLALENWVEENCSDTLIVRLPAIFGPGLKKNFLYDYIHVIPPMLKVEKLRELSAEAPFLNTCYTDQGNGFCKCHALTDEERSALKDIFRQLGFSALNFTDSRSVYQFYSLEHLWSHIEKARANGLKRLNVATPPLSAGEVYQYLAGTEFNNELARKPFDYDMKSRYAELFQGASGYLMSREQVLKDIAAFVRREGGYCI